MLALSYLLGGLPFSNLASRHLKRVDLRDLGTGTVSGTGLYQVAGFKALALTGCLDVAKGALGVALAGPERPCLQAGAAGMALTGHNWSPLLRGAGGRGLAPALGASLVVAPEATALLAAGLAGGRLSRHTAAGCLWAILLLAPLLAATRGQSGLLLGSGLGAPLVAKRLMGNGRPAERTLGVYLNRLVLDRDVTGVPAASSARGAGFGRRRRHR